MSDNYQPYNQQPTLCDFGPFAGKMCYKDLNVKLNIATSNIELLELLLATDEDTPISVDLKEYVNSLMEVDWNATIFTGISEGTYTLEGSMFNYIPSKTATMDRVDQFEYTIFDTAGYNVSAPGSINIVDKTPTISTQTVTLSGTEAQTFTIDLKTKTTVNNTNVDWANASSAVITTQPSEGAATITNGVITFKPSEVSAVTRTITIGYRITTIDGLVSNNTITLTVTDITPALTAKNFNFTILDSASKTLAITSYLTIKNDTFKDVTFDQPSEGNIVVNGANFTYTPNIDIMGDRTINVNYTATTTSGLSSSGVLTINITDDNIWLKSVWYGNSTLDVMTEEGVKALSNTNTQTVYTGTYAFTAGSSVYKWIVYPAAFGLPTLIVDPATNFEVSTEDYQYLTIDGVDLVCIRTYYQLNGAYQIKLI